MTCAGLEGLKRSVGDDKVEYKPMGGLFVEIRSYKTEDEVENIVAAQKIAEGASAHLKDYNPRHDRNRSCGRA